MGLRGGHRILHILNFQVGCLSSSSGDNDQTKAWNKTALMSSCSLCSSLHIFPFSSFTFPLPFLFPSSLIFSSFPVLSLFTFLLPLSLHSLFFPLLLFPTTVSFSFPKFTHLLFHSCSSFTLSLFQFSVYLHSFLLSVPPFPSPSYFLP